MSLSVIRAARHRINMNAASIGPKAHPEMATGITPLRSGCRSADEQKSVVELVRFNKDVVSKNEVAERRHQRLRWLLEHLDDDDAIVNEGKSNACKPSDRTPICGPVTANNESTGGWAEPATLRLTEGQRVQLIVILCLLEPPAKVRRSSNR